jgi:hypothetical protein
MPHVSRGDTATPTTSGRTSTPPRTCRKPYKFNEPVSVTKTSDDDWADTELPTGQHPLRIFVNSISDLFHSRVPESFIHDVFGVMRGFVMGYIDAARNARFERETL